MRELTPVPYRRRRKRKSRIGLFLMLALAAALIAVGCHAAAGLREKLLRLQYPIKYQDIVEEYAQEYALEPALVYAVIRTESKFDPYAVSAAQARGLMQLVDETGRDCAAALKISDYTAARLYEPRLNIRMGCYYLSRLLRRYDGDMRTAIAAYNGGPGNVERWLADEALVDEKGALARVPYVETRNYVESVMKAYRIYGELYQQ